MGGAPARSPDFDRWFCDRRSDGGSPPLLLPPLPLLLLLVLLVGGPLLAAASLLPALPLLLLLPPLLASEAQHGSSRARCLGAILLPARCAGSWTACPARQRPSAERGRRAPAPSGATATAATAVLRLVHTGADRWSETFLPVVEGCARAAGTAQAQAQADMALGRSWRRRSLINKVLRRCTGALTSKKQ